MKKFENFLLTGSTGWEPAPLVQWISVEVHYSSRFKFGAPELVLVISPSLGLKIMHRLFFLDSLLFKEHFIKFSIFFLNRLDRLGTGSSISLCQLIWSIDFGDFGAQTILGLGP